MESPQSTSKTEVVVGECPVLSVVVYLDRAEVTREIVLKLEAGVQEVVLTKLSKSLDKDSLRVDGIGLASITEVSYQEIAVTTEEEEQSSANPEVTQLKEERKSLEANKRRLQAEKGRVEKQLTMVTSYADSVTDVHKTKVGGQLAQLLRQENVDDMMAFIDRYGDEHFGILEKLHAIDLDKNGLGEKIDGIDKQLSNLEPAAAKGKGDAPKQKVVGILLEVKESSEVKLLFSYLVRDASWTPKYDLRVASGDKKMEVAYFGQIQQNTGEDWNSTRVSLSTATPNIGGTVPELDTCKLTIQSMELQPFARSTGTRRLSFNKKAKKSNSYSKRFSSNRDDNEDSDDDSPMRQLQATVSKGLSSTAFDISSLATIPSDNAFHKVSVGTIELSPSFEYETVPKMAPHAFLKATVKNGSKYPLLAGPANVFLDQTFVTDTSLGAVSPGEEFCVSLGVDPRIKVTYRPLQRFREQSGILSKTINYTFTQVTELKNSSGEPAAITVTDQLPISREQKLKVTLLNPTLPKKQQTTGPPANPRLNAGNNIVWKIEVAAGAEQLVTIHYQVEYPSGETIEGLGEL